MRTRDLLRKLLSYSLAVAAVLLIPLLLSGCAKKTEAIRSIAQLKEPGMIIAVSDGTPEEDLVRKDFPDAVIQPFTDMVAAYTAVADDRADVCIHSRREMEVAMANGVTGVRLLDETYSENTVAVCISRATAIPDLQKKINEFLQTIRADGTLDDMYERWVIQRDQTMPEIPKPERSEGTIRVGTTGTIMPYSYYIGNQLAGYDIELALRFAAWLGREAVFRVYTFSGIVAAAQSDRIDCIMSNFYYTEEHEEALDFSDPVFMEEVTVMVRDTDAVPSPGSFWKFVSDSFEKTFIRESRWKLLLEGAANTLLITVLSILFGTTLGFLSYTACRKGAPVSNAIARFCVWLVQGLPVVVFLMILYYIVFGSVRLSNVVVSIIGFTIIFGATVFSLLKTGIGALDKGQAEASRALGFSDRRTFYLVMLPQALPHMLQPFTEQITALIKATAIVGYIAVQDLTKIGDIIRSRTYEAFFPLITIALIYILLAWILNSLVRWIGRRADAKRRRKKSLLKGVQIQS